MNTINKTKLRILCLLLSIGAAKSDASENQQVANQLTSIDIVGPYISEALRNSPSLRAHDKRYLAARESITSNGALPNPKVQITHFVESVQTRTGPQEQALSLQQSIPWLGKLSGKRDMARAQSTALWHAYATQQFILIDRIAKQTLDIAFLDKSIAITLENIELLKRLESVVEDRVKSGGDLADLLHLQVEIERDKDSAARQVAARTSATAILDSLLGRTPSDRIHTFDWIAPKALQAKSSQWLSAISQGSPQIAMLRSIEANQEARERLARLARRPDFSVGINYISTGDSLTPTTPGNGKDPWALMVGVSLPVWGKANNAIALQASLEKEAISAQINDLEITLLGEGRSWIAKLEDADSRLQRYDTKLLPLVRQAQEITASGYQSGKNSILDLIDSDRALLKLETEYWRAAADAWLARWKLATISGGLWLR